MTRAEAQACTAILARVSRELNEMDATPSREAILGLILRTLQVVEVVGRLVANAEEPAAALARLEAPA